MKAGVRTDDLQLVLQHDAALDLSLFEIIKGAEDLIGDALIGERPQALTGLQFRCIGWQEEQVDTLRHYELFAAVPSRLILAPAARAWKGLHRLPGRRGKAQWRRSLPSRSATSTTQFGRWSAAQNGRRRAIGSAAGRSLADVSLFAPRCAARSV
jgi:hypothetical protein